MSIRRTYKHQLFKEAIIMRKKTETVLDMEAMKLGYHLMLADVNDQLEAGMHSDSIRALLSDNKQHIENRIEQLSGLLNNAS